MGRERWVIGLWLRQGLQIASYGFLRPRVLLQRGIIGVDFLVGEVDLMSILIHCSVIIHDRIPKRSLSL